MRIGTSANNQVVGGRQRPTAQDGRTLLPHHHYGQQKGGSTNPTEMHASFIILQPLTPYSVLRSEYLCLGYGAVVFLWPAFILKLLQGASAAATVRSFVPTHAISSEAIINTSTIKSENIKICTGHSYTTTINVGIHSVARNTWHSRTDPGLENIFICSRYIPPMLIPYLAC